MSEIFNINDPASRAFIPDGTFMLAYRGSIAHNMYVPNSDPKSIDDVDLMGVVIGEESDYFGLHEWGTRGTKEVKQGKYDCVFYEIRKMFSLLLHGNPNVLSLLWLRPQDYLLQTAAGKAMAENRHLFAGKHVYNAFAGYAHQQLKKGENLGYLGDKRKGLDFGTRLRQQKRRPLRQTASDGIGISQNWRIDCVPAGC